MQVELITVEIENVVRDGLSSYASVYADTAGFDGQAENADCILTEITRVTNLGWSSNTDEEVLKSFQSMLVEGFSFILLADYQKEEIEALDAKEEPFILEIKRNGQRIGFIPGSQVNY